MLPPPTTKPSCTPRPWTAFSSSLTRSMTPKSIPAPARPANASPETLRRARRYASFAATLVAPELEAHEAADLDFLTRLAGQLFHELAHRSLVVLDELLLEQDALFVELPHHAIHDLGADVLRLLLLGHLGLVHLALPLHHVRRQVLDPNGERARRGDVHGDVLGERLEVLGAGHEVGLAIHLDQDADRAVEMDVGPDPPLRRLAPGPLVGLGRALLAQDVDAFLQVAAGLFERLLAIHHAGTRAGAQLGHQFCRNLFHCRHCSSLLIKTPPSRRWAGGRRSVVHPTCPVTPRPRRRAQPGPAPLPS